MPNEAAVEIKWWNDVMWVEKWDRKSRYSLQYSSLGEGKKRKKKKKHTPYSYHLALNLSCYP